jgi:inner membrane protein
MAAARVSRKDAAPAWVPIVAWSALSLLPDADVIGFAFGVDYAAAWGHRGATHSLVFAATVGLAIGLVARTLKRAGARVAAIGFAVLAGHAVLDMMTDGGLGCALFWPFDATRHFAPWRPLPVAPIGFSFLSGQGVFVALAELLVFAPVFYFALGASQRRHRPAAAGLAAAMWLVLTWLLVSGDRVRDEVLAVLRQGGRHRLRLVCFTGVTVTTVIRQWE